MVVSGYGERDGGYDLTEPYVVNGCQSSRTIWEVFHARYSAGGTGVDPEMEDWKRRAAKAVVVVKVVEVGEGGDTLLQAITRYTNSQNAVREKDFIALTSDFHGWQAQLASKYDVYLEVQRGGWDSQKALQNSRPSTHQFVKHANAADLIKVFGAGWFNEAGTAFGKNPPFLPEGAVFKRIVENLDGGDPFGADDLYAAYLLEKAADELGFGRGGQQSRRQTRFLFYMVTIDLLRHVLGHGGAQPTPRELSAGLILVMGSPEARDALLQSAATAIDDYMSQTSDDSVFSEPAYSTFGGDMNRFLKWEKLGKSDVETPKLRSALAVVKHVMGKSLGGQPAPRQLIQAAARAA